MTRRGRLAVQISVHISKPEDNFDNLKTLSNIVMFELRIRLFIRLLQSSPYFQMPYCVARWFLCVQILQSENFTM